MTLKRGRRARRVCPPEETAIVNRSRYRVRSLPAAGALLKEEDSEERQMTLLEDEKPL
jgi:DNA gyrase subunit A